MTTLNELMAEATQHYAMAHHYLGKLKVTLDQLSAVQSGVPQASRPPVRCVREWQDWLAVNGPALKEVIQKETGVRFSERGTPYTVEWTPSLAQASDDRFAPNTIVKINTKANGRGAPPKIFFLWSQRYDVHPIFGVGPERPEDSLIDATADLGLKYFERVTADDELPPEDEAVIQELLDRAGRPQEVAETPPERYSTLDEWNDAWAGLFDSLVATETKPTDEQKQILRDSLPDGADVAALALGYQAAVIRRREAPQTLLGVIQPLPSE